ncbi:MAG: hypothetical protein ACXVAY_15780 [Mucilaginibacter sp.]
MLEKIIDIIQKQAEAFLLELDAKEFYPFGTCINDKDEIVPVGAYVEGDHPLSQDVIDLLEKDFEQGIKNGHYKIAVIIVDVLIRTNYEVYDGIEMRVFEPDKEVYKKMYKYLIKENFVEFVEY